MNDTTDDTNGNGLHFTFQLANDAFVIAREHGVTTFAVYAYLRRCAGSKDTAFPSLEDVAKALGVSSRTVKRALRVLDKYGYVTPHRRRRSSSLYSVTRHLRGDTHVPSREFKRGHPCPPEGTPMSLSGDTHVPTEETHRRNTKKKHKARAVSKIEIPIPEVLDTPEFRATWATWVSYRKEKKAPLTPLTMERQLAKLAKWGVKAAVCSINTAIEKGWQGFFEPDQPAEPEPESQPPPRLTPPRSKYADGT